LWIKRPRNSPRIPPAKVASTPRRQWNAALYA
jgi:hypothetical protein